MKLTTRQRMVLEAIKDFHKNNQIMPTTRELAKQFGINQNGINSHINVLVEKGAIKRIPFKARALILVDEN